MDCLECLTFFQTILLEVVCVGKASTYRGILQLDFKDFLSSSIENSVGDSETGSKSDLAVYQVDSLAWLQTTAPIFKHMCNREESTDLVVRYSESLKL
jgi:hypothetical protein